MPGSVFCSLQIWLHDILGDTFKRTLIIFLFVAGLVVYAGEQRGQFQTASEENQVSFFFQPSCPHCQEQKKYNSYLKAKYPKLEWIEYDTSMPQNVKILLELLKKNGLSTNRVGVPMTFIGTYVISGFDTPGTTGRTIESAIKAFLRNDPTLFKENTDNRKNHDIVDLPFLGEIKLLNYPLLSLAIVLGLVDGFNPCAMWVLVYLISVIMTLKDRKKIWFLVGTFVGASGVLYFLFMTAWLNVFLLFGYIRILTLTIGIIAIGGGVLQVREYLQTKGELVCKIGDPSAKKNTMGRIEQIAEAPLNIFSVLSIIILAFIVNSIEFACSAALPAIFTYTLSLRNLPAIHYYGYILIYDFFFMLDDMIIFSLAVWALDTDIGTRYAKHCKIIGGGLLLIIGLTMVFAPEILR